MRKIEPKRFDDGREEIGFDWIVDVNVDPQPLDETWWKSDVVEGEEWVNVWLRIIDARLFNSSSISVEG